MLFVAGSTHCNYHYRIVQEHLPSTSGSASELVVLDATADDVALLKQELAEAVRIVTVIVGKRRSDKVEQEASAVVQQAQLLRKVLQERVPQWQLEEPAP